MDGEPKPYERDKAYETLLDDWKYLYSLQEKINEYICTDRKDKDAKLEWLETQNENLMAAIKRSTADLEQILDDITK